MSVSYPLGLDSQGRTAMTASRVAAAEQLLEELLFTAPGDRLNEPTMGCGLMELVFEPASDELRAATQFQVMSSLHRWLGDVIQVSSVVIAGTGSELEIEITYELAGAPGIRTAVFQR